MTAAVVEYRDLIVINGLDISNMTRDYLSKMRDAGITAANCTVTAVDDCRKTIDLLADWLWKFEEYSDIILQVQCVADIDRAKQEGKVGVILGFQDSSPIDHNADLLKVYHRLGVRIIQLAYMTKNLIGDGCLERTDCGLSNFGVDVIREMNRLGILVDLSHVNRKTTLEAIEVSAKPVVFSHANSQTVWNHMRNKTDEEFQLLAAKGGVSGVTTFPTFVGPGTPTLKEVLDHVDYLVNLIGVDHVGIGTDYIEGQPQSYFQTKRGDIGLGCKFPEGVAPPTWPWVFPEGIASISDFPNLVPGLAERGYGPEDIRKIMGENFKRVFSEVW